MLPYQWIIALFLSSWLSVFGPFPLLAYHTQSSNPPKYRKAHNYRNMLKMSHNYHKPLCAHFIVNPVEKKFCLSLLCLFLSFGYVLFVTLVKKKKVLLVCSSVCMFVEYHHCLWCHCGFFFLCNPCFHINHNKLWEFPSSFREVMTETMTLNSNVK